MKYGAILKACRERKGFSQQQMAIKMNRDQACISRFESDKKPITFEEFVKWCQITQASEVVVAFLYGMGGIEILQNITTLIGGFILWI